MTLFVHEFPGPAFRLQRDLPVAEAQRVAETVAAAPLRALPARHRPDGVELTIRAQRTETVETD